MPAIFHWPGVIPPSSVSTEVTSLMDLFPTFIELANTDFPKVKPLDGQSLVPILLHNAPSPHSVLFIYDSLRDYLVTARYGKYKIYFAMQSIPDPKDYALYCHKNGKPRTDTYFATRNPKIEKLKVPVIYNIEADPSEVVQLNALDHVDVLTEVADLLQKERETWIDRKPVQLKRVNLNHRLVPCCDPPFCTCNFHVSPHTWAQCEKV